MKIPDKMSYRIYFFLLCWISLGELAVLLSAETEPFVYYHTLKTIIPSFQAVYSCAIIRTIVNLACMYPLFIFAFNRRNNFPQILKALLTARVLADITGHNYEWQFIKSLHHQGAFLPFVAIGLWAGLFFLSYKAHIMLAFSPSMTTCSTTGGRDQTYPGASR